MSRNQKIGLGGGIGIATLVLTLIAMTSGGAIKCGQIEESIAGHEKRLDKIETAVDTVHELNGKMDVVIDMLKDK